MEANDNETTWLLLSRVNERVVQSVNEQHPEQQQRDRDSDQVGQRKAQEKLAYVNHRVREISAWEKRFQRIGVR